jgi:hypothetical protein
MGRSKEFDHRCRNGHRTLALETKSAVRNTASPKSNDILSLCESRCTCACQSLTQKKEREFYTWPEQMTLLRAENNSHVKRGKKRNRGAKPSVSLHLSHSHNLY